jgi:hypothetical protein
MHRLEKSVTEWDEILPGEKTWLAASIFLLSYSWQNE